MRRGTTPDARRRFAARGNPAPVLRARRQRMPPTGPVSRSYAFAPLRKRKSPSADRLWGFCVFEGVQMHTIATPGLWAAFVAVVLAALALDFLVLRNGGARRVSFRDALVWSIAWVSLAILFNVGLWWWLDVHAGRAIADEVGLEFLTGYVVEKSLAIDNIFVFLMVFNTFSVPAEQRRRVLMLGVLGAIVLRAIMIFIGAELVARFHWILYAFGLFLMFTGIKMLRAAN